VITALHHITLNSALASIGLLLGLLAALAGTPDEATSDSSDVDVNAILAGKRVEMIDANTLAEWIMENRHDYPLLDLRPQKEYERYHIPFAVGVRQWITENPGGKIEERMVVYAEGALLQKDSSGHSSSADGELIYVLRGGLEEWKRTVLFPDLSDIDRLAEEDVKRIRRVSIFFGGNPGTGGRGKAKPEVLYDREGC
jgi:rhodanese-related sulfurtransferase